MLAMLTLCCLAQRSGSLTALARWSRARRRILPPRRSRPVAAQLVGARVGRISTCATCGETRPTLRTGRALAHLCSCVCGCSSRAVCVGLAPLRGFQCKNLAVGQHHTARKRRLSSDAPEPTSRRSGPWADGKGGMIDGRRGGAAFRPPPGRRQKEPARLRHFTGSRAPCLYVCLLFTYLPYLQRRAKSSRRKRRLGKAIGQEPLQWSCKASLCDVSSQRAVGGA